MPAKIQEAMQMQVEAERRKRASILESEGKREAAINVAEVRAVTFVNCHFQGEKKARILASEADELQQVSFCFSCEIEMFRSTELEERRALWK